VYVFDGVGWRGGAPQRATFQRLSDWGNGRGGKEEGWEHRLGVGVGVLYGGALG